MELIKVKLSQVAVNANNPRTITDEKLHALIVSILTFPKMLELRPVVVDSTYTALGGNMRTTALNKIARMSASEVFDCLCEDDSFNALTDAEKQVKLDYWAKWIAEPTCLIVMGDSLTDAEKDEFIAKDNISYGAWDWQKLTKKFSPMKLQKWGMDGVPNFIGMHNPISGEPMGTETENDAQSESFVENATGTEFVNLPPELAGLDIEPEEHENITGDDKTEYSRVIITYKEEDLPNLCALLGIAELNKVVYTLDELVNG